MTAQTPPNGPIVDGNGKLVEKRIKAVEIWVIKDSNGESTLELIGPPNKHILIETLCDALKIASSLEFKKQKPVIEQPGMLRFFRKWKKKI